MGTVSPYWYEDLAARLRQAHDEALFSGDATGAEAFLRAQLRARQRGRRQQPRVPVVPQPPLAPPSRPPRSSRGERVSRARGGRAR